MTTNAENSNAALGAVISAASHIGRGFDIFGTYRLDSGSAKSQLIELSDLPMQNVSFLGANVQVPKIMTLSPNTSTTSVEGSDETRESFQNKFSVNVGVEATYGFFSGQFNYAYKHEYEHSSEYKYAFKNVYTGLGNLVLDNLDDGKELEKVLKPAVKARIKALNPDWEKHYEDYALFFNDYGTHYVYQLDIGSSFEMYTSILKTSQLSKTEIDMAFSAQYKGAFFSGSFSVSTKDEKAFQKYRESSRTRISAMGGDATLLGKISNVAPFENNVALYNQWVDSVKYNPAAINFKLRGIWMLCDVDKRKAMQAAFNRYKETFRVKTRIESMDAQVNFFVGGNHIPEPAKPTVEADKRQGWRFTVVDRYNLGKIIHNKYYGYDPYNFSRSATAMYDSMKNDIESLGLNNKRYLWMMSTYGRILAIAPPTSTMYTYMTNAGGGDALNFFTYLCKYSSSDSVLMRYNLIGVPQSGTAAGIENYSDNNRGRGTMAPFIKLYGVLDRSIIDGSYSITPDPEAPAMLASGNAEEQEAVEA